MANSRRLAALAMALLAGHFVRPPLAVAGPEVPVRENGAADDGDEPIQDTIVVYSDVLLSGIALWRKSSRRGEIELRRVKGVGAPVEAVRTDEWAEVVFPIPLIVGGRLTHHQLAVHLPVEYLPDDVRALLPKAIGVKAKPVVKNKPFEQTFVASLANWVGEKMLAQLPEHLQAMVVAPGLWGFIDPEGGKRSKTLQKAAIQAQDKQSENRDLVEDLERWASGATNGHVEMSYEQKALENDPLRRKFSWTVTWTFHVQKAGTWERRTYHIESKSYVRVDRYWGKGSMPRRPLGVGLKFFRMQIEEANDEFSADVFRDKAELAVEAQAHKIEQDRKSRLVKEDLARRANYLSLLPVAIDEGAALEKYYDNWIESRLGTLAYFGRRDPKRGAKTISLVHQASEDERILSKKIAEQPERLFSELLGWAERYTRSGKFFLKIEPRLTSDYGGGYKLVFSLGGGELGDKGKKVLFFRRAPTDAVGLSAFSQVETPGQGVAFLKALKRSLAHPGVVFVSEANAKRVRK